MKRLFRSKESVLGCLLVLVSLLVPFLVCEAAYRVKNVLRPQVLGEAIVPDALLGWRIRPGYRFSGEKKDASGRPHPVEIAVDGNGFREYGPERGRLRVFCLGDSFTFAKDVSQNETYYHVAGELAPADVFACGVDGYGGMQEYLVLDQWIDRVKPDVVVWQFCLNDFIGNDVRLTRMSAKNQCQAPQPFLTPQGKVRYASPGEGSLGRIARYLPSAFLRAMAHRIDNRKGLPTLENTVETRIEKGDAAALALFRESVETTDRIMAKVRARCGRLPIVAFNVDTKAPYHGAFREIFARHGIKLLDTVPALVQEAAAKGETVFAGDGAHWNAAGHRICGEVLAGVLKEVAGAR
jgi:hypothetical protein